MPSSFCRGSVHSENGNGRFAMSGLCLHYVETKLDEMDEIGGFALPC